MTHTSRVLLVPTGRAPENKHEEALKRLMNTEFERRLAITPGPEVCRRRAVRASSTEMQGMRCRRDVRWV
jgi:hypothetical protein